MSQRLVDVLDSSGAVLHTYPVTLGELGDAADDSHYEEKALGAAAHGHFDGPNSRQSRWSDGSLRGRP
jgi:hypothetical protein